MLVQYSRLNVRVSVIRICLLCIPQSGKEERPGIAGPIARV